MKDHARPSKRRSFGLSYVRPSPCLERLFSKSYTDHIKDGWLLPRKIDEEKQENLIEVEDKREFAKLSLPDGTEIKLPIIPGTCGAKSLDIRGFYSKCNMTFYDPGFTSTASCHSAITYIDGGKGELLHRGYHITDLCEHSSHVELMYLLLYGELPTKQQLEDHEWHVTYHTLVHEKLIQFFKGFKSDAHPMAIMCGVV